MLGTTNYTTENNCKEKNMFSTFKSGKMFLIKLHTIKNFLIIFFFSFSFALLFIFANGLRTDH